MKKINKSLKTFTENFLNLNFSQSYRLKAEIEYSGFFFLDTRGVFIKDFL